MNADKINPWLTLIANIGVLIGLVLLVVEIQQNTELAKAQFFFDRSTAVAELELINADPNFAATWARSIQEPQSLTPAEYRMMDSYLAMRLNAWTRIYDLEQRGLEAPGSTERAMRPAARIWFGNSFAKTWWKYEKLNGYDPDGFGGIVDRVIFDVGTDENLTWIENLRNDIAAESSATPEDQK